MKARGPVILALAGILLCALAVRWYDLAGESVWLDEMYSIKLSQLSWHGIVEELSRDVHPPLYYFILKPWAALWGTSEAGVRSLSLCFGVLSVALTFFVGKGLFGPRTGLYSALFMAFSLFQIHYSQETRSFSLLGLLTLLSFQLFFRVLDRPSRPWLAALAMATAALAYTHLFGLFVPASQTIIYVLFHFSKKEKPALRPLPLLACFLAAALLFLPWASVLQKQAASAAGDFWIPRPSVLSVGYTFLEFSGSIALAPFFLLLTAAGLAGCRSAPRQTIALLLWIVMPAAIALLLSLVFAPIYVNKALIGSSPVFFILAARGLDRLAGWKRHCLLLLVILGSFHALHGYYRDANKEPWREAAQRLKGQIRESDAVVFYAGYMRESLEYYLGLVPGTVIQMPWEGGPLTGEKALEALKPVEKGKRVWLVLSHASGLEGLIRNELSRGRADTDSMAFPVRKYVLPGRTATIEVHLFQPKAE